MNRAFILRKLRDLGLSDYESKSYLSLMEKDSLTVAEAAKIAGIPRQSAYEAFEKLMIKGLCLHKPGETKRYSASNPDLLKDQFSSQVEEAIAADGDEFDRKEAAIVEKYEQEMKKKLAELHKEREKKAKQHQVARESIISVTRELKPYYEQSRSKSDPLDYIEVIRNPNQIHRKYIELYSKAQTEVLAFNKAPYTCTTKEKLFEQQQVQFDATDRGVKQRTIIEMPPQDEAIAYFEKIRNSFRDDDIEIEHHGTKVVDELPIKLFIFDRKICMFTLEDPIKEKTSMTMLVTEHEAMAKCFLYLYEAHWKNGRDYFIINNKKYYFADEPDKWDWDTKGGE